MPPYCATTNDEELELGTMSALHDHGLSPWHDIHRPKYTFVLANTHASAWQRAGLVRDTDIFPRVGPTENIKLASVLIGMTVFLLTANALWCVSFLWPLPSDSHMIIIISLYACTG